MTMQEVDDTIELNRACGAYLSAAGRYDILPNPDARIDKRDAGRTVQRLLGKGRRHRWGGRDFWVDRSGALHAEPV